MKNFTTINHEAVQRFQKTLEGISDQSDPILEVLILTLILRRIEYCKKEGLAWAKREFRIKHYEEGERWSTRFNAVDFYHKFFSWVTPNQYKEALNRLGRYGLIIRLPDDWLTVNAVGEKIIGTWVNFQPEVDEQSSKIENLLQNWG